MGGEGDKKEGGRVCEGRQGEGECENAAGSEKTTTARRDRAEQHSAAAFGSHSLTTEECHLTLTVS